MSDLIKVGMADLKTCKSPEGITTLALGSCVGIAIRDTSTKIGGLAHIMLSDSTKIKNNSNLAKFADTGIDELVRQMKNLGAVQTRMVAKIAGGAQMFAINSASDIARVGDQNIIAVKKKLAAMRIPILADDTGLNYGRTVEFFPETGEFKIKSVGKPIKTI